ncbi:MAG: BACON domain-containing carbohydrate-binding protein [Blastocatellales bacterium]
MKALFGALLLLSVFAPAAMAQVSVSGWTPPARKVDEAEAKLSSAERAARGEAPLSRKYPQIRIESSPVHRLPAPKPEEAPQKDSKKRLRVGIIRPFAQPIDALADGAGFDVAEGRLRVFRAVSEGAAQCRLHFSQLDLPQGARLFVYSAKNPDQFFGPIANRGADGSGEFWTPPMEGDEVVVEYFTPASVEETKTSQSPFIVTEVGHVFSDPRNHAAAQANCQVEVPAEWSEAAKSTALLQFILPDGDYICTGTLMNTANNSGTPYVLTANHCFDTRSAANSLKVYWFYDFGTEPPSGGPVTYGSKLLATGQESDFTFVLLNNPPPNGVRFSGWTSEKVADAAAVTGIHHPEGEHKRIAFGNTVNENCPEDLGDKLCDNFLKVRWNSGVTAPGSSGSGLWAGPAADPKLAGTLLGGSSACDNRSGVDFYGRFDITLEAVSFYLTERGCLYSTSLQKHFVGANGGSGQAEVLAREGEKCDWTAQSNAPWITINSGGSGTDEGVIAYTIAPNTASSRRGGMLNIGGRKLIVVQAGAGESCNPSQIALGQTINGNLGSNNCRSAVSPLAKADRYTFTAEAGQSFAVSLNSLAFDGYLTLFGPNGEILGENDSYSSSVDSRIPAGPTHNPGFITATVAGVYTIEVTSVDPQGSGNYTLQLIKSCVYAITNPIGKPRFEFSAGSKLVSPPQNWPHMQFEIKGGNCRVEFDTDSDWLSGYSYNDGTPVILTPQPNNDKFGRAGVLKVAGIPVIVKQSAFCNDTNRPAISPATRTVSGSGGQFSVDVTMAPGAYCTWNIAGERPPIWLIMAQDIYSIEDTGNGKVSYYLFPHDGVRPRASGFTIANQKHTLTQEPIGAGCQPSPMPFGRAVGGALSQSDCPWVPEPETRADHYTFNGLAHQQVAIELEAVDSSAYAILFDPAGDRVLELGLDQPGKTRFPFNGEYRDLPSDGVYTVVVYGKPGRYSVKLDSFGGAACAYRISAPELVEISPNGANGNVNLTAGASCDWTAKSDANWVTFPEGESGKGGKNIVFAAAPNTGAARIATVTIANRKFKISQDAPCSYVKVGPKRYVKHQDESFIIYVDTGRSCPITAVSRSAWITPGMVYQLALNFSIQRNDGPARKGAIEINGQQIEVYQGATNLTFFSAADYKPSVAAGSIVSIFSEALSLDTEAANRVPLPTLLANTSITIFTGSGATSAPLFYVSPTQINLQIPEQISDSRINFNVWTSDGASSTGSVELARVAPGLFSANASGQGPAAAVALRYKADGSQVYEPVARYDAAQGKFVSIPIDLSDPAEQVFLLLFGTGIRNAGPAPAVSARIGGENAEVLFSGAQGGFVGLDQVNVRLPRGLIGRGEVDVMLTADGKTSNSVRISIK